MGLRGNRVGECELDTSGRGQGMEVGSCEYSNELCIPRKSCHSLLDLRHYQILRKTFADGVKTYNVFRSVSQITKVAFYFCHVCQGGFSGPCKAFPFLWSEPRTFILSAICWDVKMAPISRDRPAFLPRGLASRHRGQRCHIAQVKIINIREDRTMASTEKDECCRRGHLVGSENAGPLRPRWNAEISKP
jgi:hypothetical protein